MSDVPFNPDQCEECRKRPELQVAKCSRCGRFLCMHFFRVKSWPFVCLACEREAEDAE